MLLLLFLSYFAIPALTTKHMLCQPLVWRIKCSHSCGLLYFSVVVLTHCCALLCVVQAHLEAQWEEATLRATRVMNALEFIAEAPVRRCDVRDMLEKRARAATGGQQVCVSGIRCILILVVYSAKLVSVRLVKC
jgi:hypothetical protein